MSLKVYLAAPFSWKMLMEERAAELRTEGIGVTSSWLKEPHKPTTQLGDLAPEQHRIYAQQDWRDILNSDLMIFWDDPTIARAGRHVEFGIALAWGLPVFVVGENRANIFHYMPQVTHFPDWVAAKAAILPKRYEI